MASKKRSAQDPDNPEWTVEDFARARPAEEVLSPEVLRAFKGRGVQVGPKKIPVSLRLSRDVVTKFRATGKGWQSRMDGLLLDVVKHGKISKDDIISFGPKPARNVRRRPPKQTHRAHAAKKA
jgi:uncharacterized protein (DUF4415 family)